jgi:uncharacterized delta-60 repeat protein
VQPDGKIVVAGVSFRPGHVPPFASPHFAAAIVRYLPDGTLDPTFGSGGITVAPFEGGQGDSLARRVFIHTDGTIYVAGEVAHRFDFSRALVGLLHLNADGSIDRAFGPEGWAVAPFGARGGNVFDMVAKLDGEHFYVVGFANALTGAPGSWTAIVILFDRSGAVVSSFGTGGRFDIRVPGFTDTVATSVALDFFGRVVISGKVVNRGGPTTDIRWFVTRLIP